MVGERNSRQRENTRREIIGRVSESLQSWVNRGCERIVMAKMGCARHHRARIRTVALGEPLEASDKFGVADSIRALRTNYGGGAEIHSWFDDAPPTVFTCTVSIREQE